MAQNHVLLESIELSQTASSVTFDNIPQTGYTDLKVILSVRMSNSSNVVDDVMLSLNGSTSSFTMKRLFGAGTGTPSGDGGGGNSNWVGIAPNSAATSDVYGNLEFYIPGYTSSNLKNISAGSASENAATAAYVMLTSLLWSNTAAITSMTLSGYASSFLAGSTFSLYGVAEVNTTPVTAPFASGGNIVANDGTYWYHAFLSSGYFVPLKALTADVLVVAGGGSGGTSVGGGGGAGGLLAFTSQALTSGTSYPCTIGAGGPSVGSNSVGTDGSPSQFSSLTQAAGGGGGGSYAAGKTGRNGGSGGGAGGWDVPATGGSASPAGQGNAGGSVTAGSYSAGGSGGGGGAGGAGGSYTGGTTGASGGRGTATYSSWGAATSTGVLYSGSYYFAAGGPGVYGSGGTQASASFGTVAFGATTVANSGQGGCGDTGGAGGSGIVIIRYPMV